MNRKLKLALAALLGFSGACSSVKNAPKGTDSQQPSEVELIKDDTLRRIKVMYGVPNPRPQKNTPLSESQVRDSLRRPVNRHPSRFEVDPVAEEPKD